MNNFRKLLVQKAFKKLDIDNNGQIDIRDIKNIYDTSRHPSVVQGKKTPDEVLEEFLTTFEAHHDMAHNWRPDGIITPNEFEEY